MKTLKIWGPWKDNPSDSKNFYDVNESFEDEELEEIKEDLDEKIIEDVIIEKSEEEKPEEKISESEIEDPYASILDELK